MATARHAQLGETSLATRSRVSQMVALLEADKPKPPEPTAAESALDAAHESFAAYERRKLKASSPAGQLAMLPFAPYQTATPEGLDPFSFVAELESVAKDYGSKTEIVVMEVATSSDEAAESVKARMRQLGRNFVNPLLITLDLLKPQLEDQAQAARRDQIREAISELVIPSLIVTAPQTSTPA